MEKPTPIERKDRNKDKIARVNLAIINGQRKGRLVYPKYGGGSGNTKQEE